MHMTPAAIARMKVELERLLSKDRPEMIKEVQRTAEMGDFSENFAYQQAKHALRRINTRIMTLEDKIKRAIPIDAGTSGGVVRLGSTVVVDNDDKRHTFEIVGPHETNPTRGRISHQSPLGVVLIGHAVGDEVIVGAEGRSTTYRIISID